MSNYFSSERVLPARTIFCGLQAVDWFRVLSHGAGNSHPPPRPLHYQFEVEYTNQYGWESEEEGPKDWIVKIKKV